MPSWNSVQIMGNLTRDVECRMFANGGKVANFAVAVNERTKNKSTGQWEEAPIFLDVKFFNQEKRQLADLCEQYLRKGSPVFVSGKLSVESWEKDGQKRTKTVILGNDIQFLGSKRDSEQQASVQRAEPVAAVAGGGEEDTSIPF